MFWIRKLHTEHFLTYISDLVPELLQSDEFWLLESSSSSRDVPNDDIAAETTVSVGLRGSLLFIADVARMLVLVVDVIIFCGSIGSIWNRKEGENKKEINGKV